MTFRLLKNKAVIIIHYAPFPKRIFAFLLDYLIIMLYGILILGTIAYVFAPVISPLFSNSPFIAQLTGFLLITLPVSLYFILMEQSSWQGTWGKKKMGIRTVTEDGHRLKLRQSTIRTVGKFLPWEVAHFAIWHLILPSSIPEFILIIILIAIHVVIILYLVLPFTNKQRKNLYDWLAGTTVIVSK